MAVTQFGAGILEDSVAPKYSSSSTYAIGDICIYNSKIYKCKTAISTGETFTPAKWDEITIYGYMNANAITTAEIDAMFT